jgi:hypothetical protein
MFSIFSIISCLLIKNHLPLPHGKRKGRKVDEYMFLRIRKRGKARG